MYKKLLAEDDLRKLKKQFSITSNKDFCEYFNWYINDCRENLLHTLRLTDPTSSLINRYLKPFNISVCSVKRFAASQGWYKDRLYISRISSMKAKKLQLQIKRLNAIDIESPTKWFRSIGPGETSLGRFPDSSKCKSVSVLLNRWNKTEGREKGIFIYAKYYYEVNVIELSTSNPTNENIDKKQ